MKPNCDQFFDFLKSIVSEYKIIKAERGGDYDANPARIELADIDDAIEVSPYVEPNGAGFIPGLGQEIYAIEVRSASSDSRGGCNSSDEKVCVAYGIITGRLRKAGFRVVNHYSEIF